MPTVAETMIATLKANGVKRIYGVAGDSLNGLTDAVRKDGTIDWLPVRHEETAAFAAGAEAEMTGNLAVCAGSCGPGNLHLINGLYDANRNRVPVLAIAAHIPGAEIGSNYFQETHPTELFREASVFCEMVSTPEQMPRLLEIAMRTAVERRGVAVLVMPGEVALGRGARHPGGRDRNAAGPRSCRTRRTWPGRRPCSTTAKTVTILAGAGVAGAHARGHGGRRAAGARRWCMRCAARNTSSTTTPTTSA